MRLPRDVERHLQDWRYWPLDREDFAKNLLSSRIGPVRDGENDAAVIQSAFVSLCAIPRGRSSERVADLQVLATWLDPNPRQYNPRGLWLPFRNGKRFTSYGVVLFEEDFRSYATPKQWSEYVLIARDGYVEYGRQGGFLSRGQLRYRYAPLVCWIQRFAAFTKDLQGQLTEAPSHYLVFNMQNSEGAILCAMGEGWAEPGENFSVPSQSLEQHVQIARPLGADDDPSEVARWFAERIANAFGEGQPRCYNRIGNAVGELPTHKSEF